MVRFAVISVVVAVCALVAARGLSAWTAEGAGHPAVQAAVTAPPAAPAPAPTSDAEAGDAAIAKSPDGHYWADADVNGRQIHFLVDTGATAVALTADDARNLGFVPENLNYSYTVATANGPARAAAVKLNVVSVGGVQVDDVDAFVIDKGLPTSLLGMSYLGRLTKFEATPDQLVLRS
jgi:aspartyl protease family protein